MQKYDFQAKKEIIDADVVRLAAQDTGSL